MPTPTYVAIAKTVLSVDTASVTLSSIPSTYTDLLLAISARDNGSASYQANGFIKFNNTSNNYSDTYLRANFASASSSRDSNQATGYIAIAYPSGTATTNTFGNNELYIPNYAGSTNKVMTVTNCAENNNANSANITAVAFLWQQTTAISSIVLTCDNSFLAGSRFDLYGIKSSS